MSASRFRRQHQLGVVSGSQANRRPADLEAAPAAQPKPGHVTPEEAGD
jgi:hypothetical protein